MIFSVSFFVSIFPLIFNGKWLPNGAQKYMLRRAFEHPFRDLFVYVDFMLNLTHLGLPFGGPLAHFGLPLAHFLLLLANFWCPLAHFWCLRLTFGDPGARFSRFWCPLASFSIFRFTTWMGS